LGAAPAPCVRAVLGRAGRARGALCRRPAPAHRAHARKRARLSGAAGGRRNVPARVGAAPAIAFEARPRVPALLAASLGFQAPALEPPSSVRFAWRPEARARPPNEAWSITPPVRGPPV